MRRRQTLDEQAARAHGDRVATVERPDDLRIYLGLKPGLPRDPVTNPGILVYDSSQLPYPANTPTSNYHATVTISYPFVFLTGFFGAGFTMTGKAAMQCGG